MNTHSNTAVHKKICYVRSIRKSSSRVHNFWSPECHWRTKISGIIQMQLITLKHTNHIHHTIALLALHFRYLHLDMDHWDDDLYWHQLSVEIEKHTRIRRQRFNLLFVTRITMKALSECSDQLPQAFQPIYFGRIPLTDSYSALKRHQWTPSFLVS